jgi:hypothetical protein
MILSYQKSFFLVPEIVREALEKFSEIKQHLAILSKIVPHQQFYKFVIYNFLRILFLFFFTNNIFIFFTNNIFIFLLIIFFFFILYKKRYYDHWSRTVQKSLFLAAFAIYLSSEKLISSEQVENLCGGK